MLPLLDFNIPWYEVDGSMWGILLQLLCLFYCFCGLAIICDEHMVPSLDTLCHRWGIGEDVAGATFMAFGSAAPEMIINVVATIQAQTSNPETTSLGVSAIIGSGMIAFSLIPAACGFCAPGDLLLKRRPLFRDQYFYLQSLTILLFIIMDGTVKVWEAAILVVNYAVYLFVIVFASKIRRWYWENVLQIQWADKDEQLITPNTTLQSESCADEGHEINTHFWKNRLSEMGFDDFVIPFEEHEWDDAQLWKAMTSTDFEKMGINKRGRVAKFRRYLEDVSDDRMFTPGIFDESFEDEEESEESVCIKILEFLCLPLNLIFDNTCPDCELGHEYESYYLVTFFISLFYVAIFSFVLSSIIERWVELSGLSMIFFGLILVSLGAEIPDTIESVTVAKKGYGSMAVSNCQGTQVINICLGLGLPWLMTTLGGRSITLNKSLIPPAIFQFVLVFINIFLLLGTAICQGLPKAVLGKKKSVALVCTYFSCITGMGIYLHHVGEI